VGRWSNGSPFLDGSRGSRVIASDPLTHDDEITVQWLAIFLFLVDVKVTHSVSAISIAGGFILIYDTFCSQDREGCPVPPCHAPS